MNRGDAGRQQRSCSAFWKTTKYAARSKVETPGRSGARGDEQEPEQAVAKANCGRIFISSECVPNSPAAAARG